MSEYLTTKEVATLLRLKERKVYDLAARGDIPCMKATGKLLFPHDELKRWMISRGGASAPSFQSPDVVLGSHDPLLEWAIGASGCGLPTLIGGSLDGLDRFSKGNGSICGIHIPNTENDDWNLEIVEAQFAERPAVLIHWARRVRGLIVRPSITISGFSDLRGARVVRRQQDSGAQQLFEQELRRSGLTVGDIDCTREVRTETEAALTLVEGQADVTFGLKCFADRYNLTFHPICTESFDLLVDRHAYFELPFQTLLGFTKSEQFMTEVLRYPGYDVSSLGAVRFNGRV